MRPQFVACFAVLACAHGLPCVSDAVEEAPPAFVRSWGSNGYGDGQMGSPHGVGVSNSGEVYVADTFNRRVQKFTPDGVFLLKWGAPGGGPGDSTFGSVGDVAVAGDGSVYVVDTYGVKRFTSNGALIARWGESAAYYKCAVNDIGHVFIVDGDDHRVRKFTADGDETLSWGSSGQCGGRFGSVGGIAVGTDGTLYVGDHASTCIQAFTPNGQFLFEWGPVFGGVDGLATDPQGNVYVTLVDEDRIRKYSSTGELLTEWGTTGSGPGQFRSPRDVAVDRDGNIYVADTANHRIQKFAPSGTTPVRESTWGRIKSLYR